MKVLALILVLFTFVSCSSDGEKKDGKTPAESLFKEAKELKEDKHFILANEKLNEIKSKYPYSIFATDAELMQADILFEQESFAESAAAYIVFRDFHPSFKDADFVLFRIAESNYNLIPPTVDRDLSSAVESIKYFKELLVRYPDSKYSKGSKEKIISCEKMLRQKDQYIADFYFRTNVFSSAYVRYVDMIKSYSDLDTIDHSIKGALMSLAKQDKESECEAKKAEFKSQFSDLVSKQNISCKNN